MSSPTDYSSDEVVIINAPVGKWANDLFQTTQLMQPWEDTFDLGGIPVTFTSSPDGSMNLALMISASNSPVTLANIVTDVDEGLLAIAKNNSGTLQSLVSSLISTVQDTGDFSLWDIVSNIGDNYLTSNNIFDLSQFLNVVQKTLQITNTTQDVFNVLMHGGSAATTAGADVISDTQVCADILGLVIDTLPQGYPNLSTNPLYYLIQHCVDVTIAWVDPNGTQIIPSFYSEDGTLVLGYDPSSGNIIYNSNAGMLIAGDEVYRAYLQESGSDTYNMVLNSLGGQGIVPYIVSTSVGQGNTQTYTGQAPTGTQPSIALVPASSSTLEPQLQAVAMLTVTGTEGSYVLTAIPQLSNGSSIEATSAYAIIDGTSYQMTEINPDSFILNLPAVFVSGPISVYVIVPNVVGGYGSIVVGATSSSQTWYLNSTGDPAMEKTGTQTGSVDIAAGKYVTWFSDQQAQTNVTFPSGTWTIKLKVPSDWSTNCSAEVGDFNQGSNTFIPFNGTAATGTYGNGVITITITTSGIVSQNHYLALKIINNGTADHSVTTDGSSSLTSPTNDPGYPLPAEITAYSVPGETGSANINSGAGTIGVTVPSGTNVTALVATFTTSAGVSAVKVGVVSQVSGTTPNNFTSPVTYVVTAQAGNTKNWVVTVTVAPSTAAEITAYSVPGETGSANINSGAGTIGVTVPSGTNVTALVTTFTTSAGVSSVKVGIVSQVSGTTPNNFTSNPPPQLYKRK